MQSVFVVYVNSGISCNTYLRYIADRRQISKSKRKKFSAARWEPAAGAAAALIRASMARGGASAVGKRSAASNTHCTAWSDVEIGVLTFYFRSSICRLPTLTKLKQTWLGKHFTKAGKKRLPARSPAALDLTVCTKGVCKKREH